MRRVILGTAGHIDHGKTALVRELTGVDTDRLKEEKERGITIDLGFTELVGPRGTRFGIVDVPGHEGFVRNMVAGATGMDLVLLVVAADEGVMPQTREHLAITRFLGVRRVVAVLSKTDVAEDALAEVAREEVRELLDGHGYWEAPILETSAETGVGLEALGHALEEAIEEVSPRDAEDIVRLPLDRVFTVHGTGTVVTGTLWSGRIRKGDELSVRPGGVEVRVRGVQVHGQETDVGSAGERVAVAVTGPGIEPGRLGRGQALVGGAAWQDVDSFVARIRMLPEAAIPLEPGRRVRVHLGTAEVMARVAPRGGTIVEPGEGGWIRVRLEQPVVARVLDRVVLRSYSPVTTIGGGRIVELSPRRGGARDRRHELWEAVLGEEAGAALEAALELRGWSGAEHALLPILTGRSPHSLEEALRGRPGVTGDPTAWIAPRLAERAMADLVQEVGRFHEQEPLRRGIPLAHLRSILPGALPRRAAGRVLDRAVEEGRLVLEGDRVRLPGFEAVLGPRHVKMRDRLLEEARGAGFEAPAVSELPDGLSGEPDLWPLLRFLEEEGALVFLDEERFVTAEAAESARLAVRDQLSGRSGLGPSDFRSALPVARRYLLPWLLFLDRTGVTVRRSEGREVPDTS